MTSKAFFNRICSAFPPDFDPGLLMDIAKPNLWRSNALLAAAVGLRSLINWRSYLEAYPDVAAENINPLRHFLLHGVHEGRKLMLLPEFAVLTQPQVSVVYCNYNDADYIPQSLGSLLAQSLKNIEVIAVDNCSPDNSLEIIQNMAARDGRVRPLPQSDNLSLHMARKNGVAAARGKFVMFLDSDDYYHPDACKKAYDAAIWGYDIVSFGANAIFQGSADSIPNWDIDAWLNKGKGKEYFGQAIMEAMFMEYTFSSILWNKIYEVEYAKRAFAMMEDGIFHGGQDRYEMIVLTHNATSALEIRDRLYNYRYGDGISTTADPRRSTIHRLECGKLVEPIKRYCLKHGLVKYGERVIWESKRNAVTFFVRECPERNVTEFFKIIADQYGILGVVDYLQSHFGKEWKAVADKFQHYAPAAMPATAKKHIGILFNAFQFGGVESVLLNMMRYFLDAGNEVTLFLRASHSNTLKLDPRIKIVYLGMWSFGEAKTSHIYQLYEYVTRFAVDIMYYHDWSNDEMLWDLMILKYLNIPTIVFQHVSFELLLKYLETEYNLENRLAVYRCADQLICLSRYTELFLRVNGINAQYVPNALPLPKIPIEPDFEKRSRHIAVCGRLSDPYKGIHDCLIILAEACKKLPELHMTFIGDFRDQPSRQKFEQWIKDNCLEEQVTVTGWTNDVLSFLNKAGLLLSASISEAFPMAIGEAQALGLPVVMYDLPIELARDNESIITVPQKDMTAAAEEIVLLLTDRNRWERLSRVAVQNSGKFAERDCMEKLMACVENVGTKADINQYAPEDYRKVMRTLFYYGAQPQVWKTQ